jgi:hypothetical protein
VNNVGAVQKKDVPVNNVGAVQENIPIDRMLLHNKTSNSLECMEINLIFSISMARKYLKIY